MSMSCLVGDSAGNGNVGVRQYNPRNYGADVPFYGGRRLGLGRAR